MDPNLIAHLLERHAVHKGTQGTSGAEQTRAECLLLLAQLEEQAQSDTGSFAGELLKNRTERLSQLARLDEIKRSLALLDTVESQARAQARASLWTDVPITMVAFGVAAALLAVGRLKIGFFALVGTVAAGQRLGRSHALTESVRSALAQLGAAGLTSELGSALEPLAKWKPMYLWLVSGRNARLIAESMPGLRARLEGLAKAATGKIDDSLASSVRLFRLFAPPRER